MAQTADRWDLLRQGIAAAKTGDKERARSLLRAAAEDNPRVEITWLWTATVAEGPEELEHSLEQALALNPTNEKVRAWLERARAERKARSVPPASGPPPANAPHIQARSTKWRCPICDQSFTARPQRCVQCRSILTVGDLDDFFEDHDVRRELVESAIERLERFGRTDDPAIRYRTLGLAYLNLGQPRDAAVHLRTASDLRPEDRKLRRTVRELMERLAVETKEIAADRPARKDVGTVEIEAEMLVDVRQTARQALSAKPQDAGEERRPVILVVDDSPTVRKLVEVTLERKGYQVLAAANGMESLAKMKETTPDLIILDVTMPHLDGYKICRVVKENALTSEVPVVFLSGQDGFLNKVRGRMAGAVEYLTKPVKPETLVRVVSQNLPR